MVTMLCCMEYMQHHAAAASSLLHGVSEDISGKVDFLRTASPSVMTSCFSLLLNHLRRASDRNRNSFCLVTILSEEVMPVS